MGITYELRYSPEELGFGFIISPPITAPLWEIPKRVAWELLTVRRKEKAYPKLPYSGREIEKAIKENEWCIGVVGGPVLFHLYRFILGAGRGMGKAWGLTDEGAVLAGLALWISFIEPRITYARIKKDYRERAMHFLKRMDPRYIPDWKLALSFMESMSEEELKKIEEEDRKLIETARRRALTTRWRERGMPPWPWEKYRASTLLYHLYAIRILLVKIGKPIRDLLRIRRTKLDKWMGRLLRHRKGMWEKLKENIVEGYKGNPEIKDILRRTILVTEDYLKEMEKLDKRYKPHFLTLMACGGTSLYLDVCRRIKGKPKPLMPLTPTEFVYFMRTYFHEEKPFWPGWVKALEKEMLEKEKEYLYLLGKEKERISDILEEMERGIRRR